MGKEEAVVANKEIGFSALRNVRLEKHRIVEIPLKLKWLRMCNE